MRADDLLAWNRATPFVPYRIRLNSGRTFDIRHPEMVRVGRTTVNIFTFAGDPADPYERMEMISLVLIESTEPISTPNAAT
jgi:hypothetical protein